ncbi:hypothetical protein LZ30DRAFT_79760 [Colletotrichum cereale]|nr:hypothetical protein LZ30DRAFT_79760 [Colletotrichum cereale]
MHVYRAVTHIRHKKNDDDISVYIGQALEPPNDPFFYSCFLLFYSIRNPSRFFFFFFAFRSAACAFIVDTPFSFPFSIPAPVSLSRLPGPLSVSLSLSLSLPPLHFRATPRLTLPYGEFPCNKIIRTPNLLDSFLFLLHLESRHHATGASSTICDSVSSSHPNRTPSPRWSICHFLPHRFSYFCVPRPHAYAYIPSDI